MFGIIRSMHKDGVILSAQPAAGIPTLLDGRSIYHTTPEYLGLYAKELVEAGVTLVGACCGSTPAHIAAMAKAIRGLQVGRPQGPARSVSVSIPERRKEPEAEQRSSFSRSVGSRFMTTVELDIPRGIDVTEVIEGARFVKELGIDAVNITDGARARLRMSAVAISALVQRDAGIEAITHFATRDRNMIGLQAELMGAHAFGLRNVLCISGDPAGIGDYPHATSVFDVDASGLIRAARSMNEGQDLLGNSIGPPTSFYICCAVNPVADDMDRELAKLEKKVDAGVDILFTQPVYELKTLEWFVRQVERFKKPVMVGVLPLRGAKHAEFLHNEVPGMRIPDEVRERMRHSGNNGPRIGTTIAKDFVKEARGLVAGAYMMPPFKKYNVVEELMEVARG
jgi:homocysteine S-methyltransferase